MLIELTNEYWEKFYLKADLIETVHRLMGNKSEIRLTTGRYVISIESPESINKMLKDIQDEQKIS